MLIILSGCSVQKDIGKMMLVRTVAVDNSGTIFAGSGFSVTGI
jgi:hypothetical protein